MLDRVLRSVCRLSPSAGQCNVPGNSNRFTIDIVATILPTVEGVGVVTRVIGVTGLLHGCLLAGNIILSILRTCYVARFIAIKLIRHLIGVNGGFRRGNRSESITIVGESCLAVIGFILFRIGPVLTAGVGLDIEGHDQLIAAGVGSVSYDVFLGGIVKTADRDGLCSRVKCNAYIINRFWITPRLTIAVVLLLLNCHAGDRAVIVRHTVKIEVLGQRIRQDGARIRRNAGVKNGAGDLLENTTQVATRNVHIVRVAGLVAGSNLPTPPFVRCVSVGVIGGHIVHEILDLSAGVFIKHTNRENLCTVGVLCGIRLSDRRPRLVGVIAVLSRLAICEENNNAGASLTQSVVLKHIVCHFHAVGRAGRAAGSQIINCGSDGFVIEPYQSVPIILFCQALASAFAPFIKLSVRVICIICAFLRCNLHPFPVNNVFFPIPPRFLFGIVRNFYRIIPPRIGLHNVIRIGLIKLIDFIIATCGVGYIFLELPINKKTSIFPLTVAKQAIVAVACKADNSNAVLYLVVGSVFIDCSHKVANSFFQLTEL